MSRSGDQQRNGGSGFDHLGARYFPGAQGRLTSPDEAFADQDEAEPQSWNLYPYARGNALQFVNPTGRTCRTASGGLVYDDLDGEGCAAVDEATQKKTPDVVVGIGGNEARLLMLADVGELLSSVGGWSSIGRGALENVYPLQPAIIECAARGIGGRCDSDAGILLAASPIKPKYAQAAARVARLWAITRPAATKVIAGRSYLKDAKTGTWWSRDTAGHGGSPWKVYREKPGGRLSGWRTLTLMATSSQVSIRAQLVRCCDEDQMIATAEEFVALRESSSQDEYLRAARDTAPAAVWRDVIARFPEMRKWVAVSKTVPVEILEVLARDVDPDVRAFVAMKNSLPVHLMVLLSRDQAEGVRQRIACNKKAPIDVLEDLCSDPCEIASAAALERLQGKAGENE